MLHMGMDASDDVEAHRAVSTKIYSYQKFRPRYNAIIRSFSRIKARRLHSLILPFSPPLLVASSISACMCVFVDRTNSSRLIPVRDVCFHPCALSVRLGIIWVFGAYVVAKLAFQALS